MSLFIEYFAILLSIEYFRVLSIFEYFRVLPSAKHFAILSFEHFAISSIAFATFCFCLAWQIIIWAGLSWLIFWIANVLISVLAYHGFIDA